MAPGISDLMTINVKENEAKQEGRTEPNRTLLKPLMLILEISECLRQNVCLFGPQTTEKFHRVVLGFHCFVYSQLPT